MKKHLHKVKKLAKHLHPFSFIKYFKSPTFLSVLILSAVLISYNADYLKLKAQAIVTPYISGYAWADVIIGWLSADCHTGGVNGSDVCATSNYGVTVNAPNGDLSGYMWSDNIGWLSFNCKTGGPNGEDICLKSDYRVVAKNTGVLDGYAWSDSLGWISFKAIDMTTGCPVSDCTPKLGITPGSFNSGFARVLSVVGGGGAGFDGYISLASTTFNFDPATFVLQDIKTDNGACGVATSSASYPAISDLCLSSYGSSPVSPGLSGPAPWSWLCYGTGGGSDLPICTTKAPVFSVDITPSSSAHAYLGKQFNLSSVGGNSSGIGTVYHDVDVSKPNITYAQATDSAHDSTYWVYGSNVCNPVYGLNITCGGDSLNKTGTGLDTINATLLFGGLINPAGDTYYIRAAASKDNSTWVHTLPPVQVTVTDPIVVKDIGVKAITQNDSGNTCDGAYLQYSCSSTADSYSVYFSNSKTYGTSTLSLQTDVPPKSTPKLGNGSNPPSLQNGTYILNCINSATGETASAQATCNTTQLNDDPGIVVNTTSRNISSGGSFKLDFKKTSSDTLSDPSHINPSQCKIYETIGTNKTEIFSSITNSSQSLTRNPTENRTYTLTCYPALGVNDPYSKIIQVTVSAGGEN